MYKNISQLDKQYGDLRVLTYSPPPVDAVRVYRFPMFETSFCEELLEELEHFEQSSAPKGRPNTMNHYGVMYRLKAPF